ncbi:MAG: type II toxin-antitoxin system death-on-curing family toxin [Pseudomonadota bacterium]
MTKYLTMEDVLAFHADQLRRYGGATGIRDKGQLEAALFRSQTGYYDDLIAEAAALWESFMMNHPFVDGNKRVAFAVTDSFLRINGSHIAVTSSEAGDFLYGLFDGNAVTFNALEGWLRTNTAPL